MTDILIEKLTKHIEKFLALSKKASAHLTAQAIKEHLPTPDEVQGWNSFVKTFIESYKKLSYALGKGFISNKTQVDQQLLDFRQLPRWFNEYACDWSSLYDEIRKEVKNIYKIVHEIDKKYKMGRHANKQST